MAATTIDATSRPLHEFSILEAGLTSRSSGVSTRSNYRRYFKIALLTITLVLVLGSSTIPLITKLQVADSLGGALAQQWLSVLAQKSNSLVNSTTTAAAAAHMAG